jgi:predicted porin
LNKKVLATAILAAFAGAAHAQSSVTLYGLIDAGVTYVNHAGTGGKSLYQYGDGVSQGSRWGLRGSEDLGGGLKAIFLLENGFNSGTGALGQGGALFGRQAYVGLTKDNIGSLTLGRQYSFSTDYLGGAYANGGETVAGNYGYHINDIDQLTSSRINNSIKFNSANFYGLTFGAMYGFSNQAGAFAGAPGSSGSSSAYSFGLNYNERPARHRRSVHRHPLPGLGRAVVLDDARQCIVGHGRNGCGQGPGYGRRRRQVLDRTGHAVGIVDAHEHRADHGPHDDVQCV